MVVRIRGTPSLRTQSEANAPRVYGHVMGDSSRDRRRAPPAAIERSASRRRADASESRGLVGRTVERGAIAAMLAQARNGQSDSLVLIGPAGIGKTALLTEARRMATDFRVVHARGIEHEADLAFAGLYDLFRDDVQALKALPLRHYQTLAGALGFGPPTAADTFEVAVATLNALSVLAEHRPVLVLVDDLQWLDGASRAALLFATRRLDREGVAVLMAQRDDHAAPGPSDVPNLQVTGFDEDDARRLIERHGGRPASPAVVATLVTLTGGNALALTEAAASLTAQQLAGTEPIDDPPTLGPGARLAFAPAVEQLPLGTRTALAVIAALGSATGADLLTAVLVDLGLGIKDLEPAEAAGVVILGRELPAFRHPLFRSAAYHALAPADRRRIHGSLAAIGGSTRLGDEWAWHLAAAAVGPDPAAADALVALAGRHIERNGHTAAAKALARAAALSDSPPSRCRRLVDATGAAYNGGNYDLAEQLVAEALPLVETPRTLADLRWLLARIAIARGRLAVARNILVEAGVELEQTSRRRAARFLVEAAMVSLSSLELDPGVPDARQGYALEQSTGGVESAAAAIVLAMILMGRPDEARRDLDRWQQRVQSAPMPLGDELQALPLAWVLIWTERTTAARSVLERLADAARLRRPSELPLVLEAEAELEWRAGRWSHGDAAAAEGAELAEQLGQSLALVRCLAVRARFDAAIGRAAEHHAAITRIRSLQAELAHEPWTRGLAEPAIGLRELAVGDADRAVAAFSSALEIAEQRQIGEPAVAPHYGDVIEALTMTGRPDLAHPVLARLHRHAAETHRVSATAIAARARGLLGSADDFEAHFREALGHHRRSRQPFEEARTLLLLGERRRREGRRRDARDPLRSALVAFEELGAGPWIARAQAELRATGEAVRARRVGSNELTPQEDRIALMIADGATNREAATKLFLSVKTVEYHLTKVYAKLGARSRTHLARLLRDATSSIE